ncbi:MAG: YwiC-like family protein [Anaerolineae bacterium]
MAARAQQRLNIRSVALPAEHGGWGFLIEPILLGLLVAGSAGGVLLALAGVGVFLIHQPAKIAVKDRLKGNRTQRTAAAERFALGYGLLAVVPALILTLTMPITLWLPVVLAAPLGIVQLYYDSRNQSRRLVPELCGAGALAMIAPAIAILGGWFISTALVLWLVLVARALTSILYVRARLRLEHGKPIPAQPVWMTHAAVLLGTVILAFTQTVPWLCVLAFVILWARAWLGLSAYRKPRPAKVIGFQEIAYGLITVILVAVGYRLFL